MCFTMTCLMYTMCYAPPACVQMYPLTNQLRPEW